MGSNRLTEARPVRRPPNSLRSASRAPAMRRLTSFRRGSVMIVSPRFSYSARTMLSDQIFTQNLLFGATGALANDRITATALHHFGKHAGGMDRKDDDGDGIVPRQRNRRRVHHLEIAREHVLVAQLLVALGILVELGIGAVDTVDLGGLQEGFATHFRGAQGSSRIGGEIGIAGAGGKDNGTALLQMPHGTAADIGLAHRLHGDGG